MRENTPLDTILAAKLFGGGGGSVTPASIVTATGQMTAEQKSQTRANIGATDASTSIPDNVKQALLACFADVAWVDDQGQAHYDALEAALYPLDHITAVYTQSGTVYDTDSLDSLKTDLVVTAVYEGGNTATVAAANYTLSGTLTVGTSTITVSYGGKTATFDVTVSDGLLVNDVLTLDGIKNTRSGHSASATTWEDLSGNNNDFAKYSGSNNVVWGENCATFSGISGSGAKQTLTLQKNLLSGLNQMTIELVARVNGNGGFAYSNHYYGTIVAQSTWGSAGSYLRISTYDSSWISSILYGTSVGSTDEADAVIYIALVFNGTDCKQYVNGSLAGTVVVAFPPSSANNTYYIGSANEEAAFNGNLYRFGISGSALTASEIANRYAVFARRFGFVEGNEL